MHLQESGEMYLETIYVLSKSKPAVRSIDVVEHLGYSKPSVSRAVGLLKSGGYITVNEHGFITLTDEGLSVAERMFERHVVLSRGLIMLGVPPEIASEDACKIEHVISAESFEAIKRHFEP
ncbi:MAG: metal-dependent transcriptional regulator [Ruminococcaceae bacterium]|nr:metal-dependent transcriptional regulator [Oscillospiraceae bacterium]